MFAGRFSIRFCRAMSSFASGPTKRLPVLQTSGVVYFVGNGTAPSPLDDHEMHALRVGAQRASLVPHPFPATGDTVCITRGPFRGVRGTWSRMETV